MNEIRDRFEAMPIFSYEANKCGAEFCELLLVEDGETYKDLMEEYKNC